MAQDRTPKDLRYRRKFFPNADKLVFHTEQKGFVPLAILLRKLVRHLTAPELRVLIYLHLRASQYGICYPPQNEMLREIGLASTKHLRPHIKSLEVKRLISTRASPETGRQFFLVHDPRVAIQHLVDTKQISDEELFAVNDLCEDLSQPLIEKKDGDSAGAGG